MECSITFTHNYNNVAELPLLESNRLFLHERLWVRISESIEACHERGRHPLQTLLSHSQPYTKLCWCVIHTHFQSASIIAKVRIDHSAMVFETSGAYGQSLAPAAQQEASKCHRCWSAETAMQQVWAQPSNSRGWTHLQPPLHASRIFAWRTACSKGTSDAEEPNVHENSPSRLHQVWNKMKDFNFGCNSSIDLVLSKSLDELLQVFARSRGHIIE